MSTPGSSADEIARLNAVIASLTEAAAEARRAATQADHARAELLSRLSHELRNPLAPILTTLELMKLRGGGTLEQERAVIERQVGRLVRLVEDILGNGEAPWPSAGRDGATGAGQGTGK